MSYDHNFTTQSLRSLRTHWGWLLTLGILFIILGIIGLGMTVGLTMVSIIFFGILLIIAGISHIIYVFKYKNWRSIIWQALIAIFYILGGCVILYDPLLGSMIITAILAGVFIIIGITRIVMAFSLRAFSSGSKGWLFLAGLVSLFLGIILLAQWPVSGLWFIGLFIAIEILMTGWSYIIMALALRKPV